VIPGIPVKVHVLGAGCTVSESPSFSYGSALDEVKNLQHLVVVGPVCEMCQPPMTMIRAALHRQTKDEWPIPYYQIHL
jgi:predicted transcriptional regulator